MQLDRIGITPRLRNGWQAIDLGWLMARRWWLPLMLSWAIPYFAAMAILLALFPQKWLWVGALIAWWLKPLWDAAPLYIASRRLFGEHVTLFEAWRAALTQMRWELLPWLLWRRLSPTRSMDMPITILEQLRGGARSRRLSVLHLQNASSGGWLTIVCAHLELAIGFGLLGLLYWLVPESWIPDTKTWFVGGHVVIEYLNYAIFAVSAALVAPFYVVAGFSLYINRRIDLEGWDIEIRFRHLAAARRAQQAPTIAALLLLLLLLFCPALAPRSSAGEIPTTLNTEQQTSRARIEKILAGPDFSTQEMQHGWRWKRDQQTDQPEAIPQWMIDATELLERWFGNDSARRGVGSAQVLRLVLGVVLIGLFAWLLYRYRDTLREWLHLPAPGSRDQAVPAVMFGLDVRAHSLPDDVIATVRRLWQRQQSREALSLLYRAALTQLLQRYALPFRDDMTEGECVQMVQTQAPVDIADFFAALTHSWQQQAYAHIAPDTATLDAHCAQWHQVFRDAR